MESRIKGKATKAARAARIWEQMWTNPDAPEFNALAKEWQALTR
jgi:hypothetical protein